MMASINVTLGRIYWSGFRHYLKQMRFLGHNIEWIESPGWIEREFTVRGERDAIQRIIGDLRRWTAKMPITDLQP